MVVLDEFAAIVQHIAAGGKVAVLVDPHVPPVCRLTLTADRIKGIAEGCRQVAALPDPIGEVLWQRTRPNGG